ncbi:MAG: branched-chain amino acid ABC transporter permease [Chitinivibrionales bacterium]|nr:branched-chain amino acid ABC transporter permease [Chitinivibrionales bacterium]
MRNRQWIPGALCAAGLLITVVLDKTQWLDQYLVQILMYIGINIILTVSLNLVNGYMGEFSVGHAAFMGLGAYASAFFSLSILPKSALFFPAALLAGGVCAGLAGFLIALVAFKARDDYLAIITLALLMIVKSALDNMPWFGGPQGYQGIQKYTNLSWVFACAALAVVTVRNVVYSNFGRGIIALRDDEVAADLVSVNTRAVKIFAFVISSFLAGIAGGLFAHLIQFINPRSFSIGKSTDIMLMLYLGGSGSIVGSMLGAGIWTVLLEILRFCGIWRFVVAPVALIVLMIYRPSGIMGGREWRLFVPREGDHGRK